MTERQRARPQTARARILNPVSGHTSDSHNLRSAYCADLTRYDGIWKAPDSLQLYQEVILAQFSLYNFMHKSDLRLHSFMFRSHCTPVSCGGYRARKNNGRVFYSWSLTLPTHLVFSKSRTNSGSISNETPQPISFIAPDKNSNGFLCFFVPFIHETPTLWWFNVVPPSATVAQHEASIGWASTCCYTMLHEKTCVLNTVYLSSLLMPVRHLCLW